MSLLLSVLSAKLLPLIVPPLVELVKHYVLTKVPPAFIPVLAAVGGALLSAAATALGVTDIPADAAGLTEAGWVGALVSLAGVGIHQAYTRLREYAKAKKNG